MLNKQLFPWVILMENYINKALLIKSKTKLVNQNNYEEDHPRQKIPSNFPLTKIIFSIDDPGTVLTACHAISENLTTDYTIMFEYFGYDQKYSVHIKNTNHCRPVSYCINLKNEKDDRVRLERKINSLLEVCGLD